MIACILIRNDNTNTQLCVVLCIHLLPLRHNSLIVKKTFCKPKSQSTVPVVGSTEWKSLVMLGERWTVIEWMPRKFITCFNSQQSQKTIFVQFPLIWSLSRGITQTIYGLLSKTFLFVYVLSVCSREAVWLIVPDVDEEEWVYERAKESEKKKEKGN